MVGGFLGAGKTTAIRALATALSARGERVAVVTNDQGHRLVDTALCRDAAVAVTEIGGGCFCCRYDALEDALVAARAAGATVALAEAVGSCTDLVATVLSPLAERRIAELHVEPLTVVVDPFRWVAMEAGESPEDLAYLFWKQIEEADVVVLSRADLDPPDVAAAVHRIRPGVPVVRLAGVQGDGLDAWLAAAPDRLASPLDIDYDRYAAAEALLGWANGDVLLEGPSLDPRAVVLGILEALSDLPVAHVKILVLGPVAGRAHLVRRGGPVVADLGDMPAQVGHLALRINARIAVPPEVLEARLREAAGGVAADAVVTWGTLDSFRPGRPVPVHRYGTRCAPDADAACCAAAYQRADVRYLLGDSYHPGGLALTLEVAADLALRGGGRILDVACGAGTSLAAITRAYSVDGVGVDASPPAAPLDRVTFRQGDAHRLPFPDASFDAALCECALSTFASQRTALAELRRVLRPGGRVGLTDMLANGALPASVAEWVHLGTCLVHARSLADYAALAESAGLRVVDRRDATWALLDLLAGIKRRLLGAAIARATGALPPGVTLDVPRVRAILREASGLVADGVVGYGLLILERPSDV